VIGIFKQKNPANILILLVFGVLIKLPMFFKPHSITSHSGEGVLYKEIIKLLEPLARSTPSVYPVLSFLLILVQAISLTNFINKHRMMNRPNYFPGMAYMLITSLFPEWNYFSAPLIVNTILLFVLNSFFNIYNQSNAKGAVFNIGLALGIASFIFFPSLTFIIWVLFALAVMRPFRLNEWLLCITGILTPFYFYAVYLVLADQWSWTTIWPYFTVNMPSLKQSLWLAGVSVLLVLPFLTGSYYVQDSLRKMLIQVRKGWSLLLLFLLGAIFVPFINSTDNFENWIIAAIPFAAFHACTYLYSTLRIIPLLFFWLTVAFILGYQYAGPGW
jgi:hypothetical protein